MKEAKEDLRTTRALLIFITIASSISLGLELADLCRR